MKLTMIPIWLVDIGGSALMIVFSLLCIREAVKLYKRDKENVIGTYLLGLTLAFVAFACSRSIGHILKHILFTLGWRDLWRALSPFSGGLNTLVFCIVATLTFYYERVHRQNITLQRSRDLLAEQAAQLEIAKDQAKAADRLKSMFIASMSHELRTPLNSIIGFTGIILQGISGEITDDQRKELTMVKDNANHLLTLINDVIDVSKIESGQIEPFIEEFDFADLMQEVKELFKVAVDEKGLDLSLRMPEGLIIKSDERRVKQVVMNLVSNALKFTDKGKIEMNVMEEDGMVEVSVADTGIGIRKEGMDKLFKQFSRIYIKDRPTVEGTGLGLYLSQKIATILGGEIKAESEFGKGSVFTFTLPLRYKEATG